MNLQTSIWLVILLAFAAANLPFVAERVLLLGPRPGQPKSLWMRLLELLLLYLAVGMVARWLEGRSGQIASQGWEFYAITASLFLTFAFPGFVYRYLIRRGR